MKSAFFLLLLITLSMSASAQRKNPHDHKIEIEERSLLMYLDFLDSGAFELEETVLIEGDDPMLEFENIRVLYVPSISHYTRDRGEKYTYLTIDYTMHFESDSSVCVTYFLKHHFIKVEGKRKNKDLYNAYYDFGKSIQYYVQINSKTNEWALQNTNEVLAPFPFYSKGGWLLMDSTNVRQFVRELRNTRDGKYVINSITTEGRAGKSWIKEEDLAFLMTLIDSEEKAKCVQHVNSSTRFDSEDISTLGDQVTHILYCYIHETSYPDDLNICPTEDQEKKQEVLAWWKERSK